MDPNDKDKEDREFDNSGEAFEADIKELYGTEEPEDYTPNNK